MNKIEEAIIYATVMHQGKVRKLGSIPYILHPLEVAQIISTMTRMSSQQASYTTLWRTPTVRFRRSRSALGSVWPFLCHPNRKTIIRARVVPIAGSGARRNP